MKIKIEIDKNDIEALLETSLPESFKVIDDETDEEIIFVRNSKFLKKIKEINI